MLLNASIERSNYNPVVLQAFLLQRGMEGRWLCTVGAVVVHCRGKQSLSRRSVCVPLPWFISDFQLICDFFNSFFSSSNVFLPNVRRQLRNPRTLWGILTADSDSGHREVNYMPVGRSTVCGSGLGPVLRQQRGKDTAGAGSPTAGELL